MFYFFIVFQELILLRIRVLGKHNHVLGVEKKEALPVGSWPGHNSKTSVCSHKISSQDPQHWGLKRNFTNLWAKKRKLLSPNLSGFQLTASPSFSPLDSSFFLEGFSKLSWVWTLLTDPWATHSTALYTYSSRFILAKSPIYIQTWPNWTILMKKNNSKEMLKCYILVIYLWSVILGVIKLLLNKACLLTIVLLFLLTILIVGQCISTLIKENNNPTTLYSYCILYINLQHTKKHTYICI